jgi:predicted nucleotide-binding protein
MASSAQNEPKERSMADKKKKYLSQSDVPRHSIEQALRIPRAIADEYGKQPASPVDVGAAIGLQPTTGTFRSLAGASFAFGLTDGGPRVAEIGLTDLGRRAVAPTEEGDDVAALREAFLRPRVIREFLERYDGSKLPSQHIGENVLETLGVPADSAESTLQLILSGADSLGLSREIGSGKFIQLKGIAPTEVNVAAKGAAEGPTEDDLLNSEKAAEADEATSDPNNASGERIARDSEPPRHATRPNAIFVGHGKNQKPRDQLVRLLEQYKIPYKVAEEEPNKGRPIPIKVKETMRECGAAILIFSADEELQSKGGETVWRPSENAVHELGASSMLYDDRIIVFREEAVSLATNYESIGYITFEKDDLTAKFNELLRELIALGILKVSVND